jgi:2-amino-4-hydroxy-6-hydroxymethyldihydropteridine diphosphokinase
MLAQGRISEKTKARPAGVTQCTAWIGLGSNLGDGPEQFGTALKLLHAQAAISVNRVSPLYRTQPWGRKGQPVFTNGVAELSVKLEPLALLELLKGIELQMGRDPAAERWGPRTIDLDILMLDARILIWPGLRVPHPRMHLRAFVLAPLFDMEPDLVIPARGTVRRFLMRLGDKDIKRLEGESSYEN